MDIMRARTVTLSYTTVTTGAAELCAGMGTHKDGRRYRRTDGDAAGGGRGGRRGEWVGCDLQHKTARDASRSSRRLSRTHNGPRAAPRLVSTSPPRLQITSRPSSDRQTDRPSSSTDFYCNIGRAPAAARARRTAPPPPAASEGTGGGPKLGRPAGRAVAEHIRNKDDCGRDGTGRDAR